jgi:hypothetical protein
VNEKGFGDKMLKSTKTFHCPTCHQPIISGHYWEKRISLNQVKEKHKINFDEAKQYMCKVCRIKNRGNDLNTCFLQFPDGTVYVWVNPWKMIGVPYMMY